MASKITKAGRRSLVLVAVAFVAASFGVGEASATKPLKDVNVPQQLGLWDGPG